MKTHKQSVRHIVLAALFLSIGLVLPWLTGQLKEIGDTLLPMHIPVLLCGLLCGWRYGALVGLALPPLRGVLFGMPPLYPNAIWMAAELATYGLVIGLVYARLSAKNSKGVYLSLLSAMVAGRIVWGAAKAVLLGLGGKVFTLSMFIAGGFVDAVPGILLQLALIPVIVSLVQKRSIAN